MEIGIKLALATVLISGATIGGYTVLSDSGGSQSAQMTMQSYPVCTAYSNVTVSKTASSGVSGGFTSRPVSRHNQTVSYNQSSFVTSASQHTTPSSSLMSGSSFGGSGVGGGSRTTSGNTTMSGSVSSSDIFVSTPSFVQMPLLTSRSFKDTRRSSPYSPFEYDVYTGDEPGVITGNENATLDNPIVTCYDQPIGDVIVPLLIFVGLYILNKQRIKYINKIK